MIENFLCMLESFVFFYSNYVMTDVMIGVAKLRCWMSLGRQHDGNSDRRVFILLSFNVLLRTLNPSASALINDLPSSILHDHQRIRHIQIWLFSSHHYVKYYFYCNQLQFSSTERVLKHGKKIVSNSGPIFGSFCQVYNRVKTDSRQ